MLLHQNKNYFCRLSIQWFMVKIVFVFLVFFSISTDSLADYEVTENCKEARMLMMDLRLKESERLLAVELENNSENFYALYLEQTCDAYRLLINGSQEDYEAFVDGYEAKRKLMDDRFVDSPYYLACKSEMEMQVGMFNIIHGSQFSGVNKMYHAYKEVYENLEKFPEFKPSLMLDGFFNVAMSNLPPFVKWAVSFFGVSSDFKYGVATLTNLYQSQKEVKGFNAETALFVIFAAKINKSPEMVYDFTQNLDSSIRNLFIHQYFRINIAYRVGKNEQALAALKQVKVGERPYAELIYNYMMGKILLRKISPKAGFYIEQYLKNLRKQEYFKEMTYNLALFNLINGNRAKYHELCAIVRKMGSEVNERDREALYDASLDYEPDLNLVKARLLIDGGYLKEFKRTMEAFNSHPEQQLPYQLEYHFLMGRYQTETGSVEKAIDNLKWVINRGEEEEYYFACASALKLGKIYEDAGKFDLAINYYKIATNLYDSDYYEYLGAKATKALARVKALN